MFPCWTSLVNPLVFFTFSSFRLFFYLLPGRVVQFYLLNTSDECSISLFISTSFSFVSCFCFLVSRPHFTGAGHACLWVVVAVGFSGALFCSPRALVSSPLRFSQLVSVSDLRGTSCFFPPYGDPLFLVLRVTHRRMDWKLVVAGGGLFCRVTRCTPGVFMEDPT